MDGALLAKMIIHAAASINAQKQSINELNVFPVPDGDTGTNMCMTISTAAAELRKKSDPTVGKVAQTNANALLRGARGNSGVILSLLFRGFGKSLKDKEEADGADFAIALDFGVATAYKAVMKPAEGTILTVSRLCARRAAEAAREDRSLVYVLEETIKEGQIVLADTVNQNPVLQKAGVVDAGGKGFLVILQGMLDELNGLPMPEGGDGVQVQEKADFAAIGDEDITFTYDTVFIVRKEKEDVDLEPFRAYLDSIGDSLVIGESDEEFKVHVHTDTPGEALTESQKYGILELAKIENMRTQAEDLAAGKHVQSTDDLEEVERELEEGGMAPAAPANAKPEKKYGFVSVCAGEGLAAVFKDLGCDGIISGGQTMNPSTEDILKAVNATPAEVVYVLPNNKNIIMAAEQCVGLAEGKEVVVIPTKTIPQGVTALMNFDPDAIQADITQAMTDALGTVHTSQITYAARNSSIDGFDIKEGDYLALSESQLFGTEKKLANLLKKLAKDKPQQEASFITLFYGEDVAEEDAVQAQQIFQKYCPNAEVCLIAGGQPVYYYLISAE